MGVSQNLSISLVGQDVSSNTTTVNITLTSTQTGESWSGYTKTGYYWISVNGGAETQYSFTTTLPKQSTITCFSVNHTFTHNSDGTGSISVRSSLDTGIMPGTVTASSSYTPPAIPRATTPTLSVSSPELGSKVTISLPRASNTFVHKLEYVCGSTAGLITDMSETSVDWTIPLDLANQITDATQGTCAIICTTFTSDAVIGTKTIYFTVTVPASVVPAVSAITLTDPCGYASTYGGYVQNKSKLKVQVTSTGVYSSTIKTVSITANGSTVAKNTYETNVITESGGSKTVSVTVTDSRGRSSTATASYIVLDYISPTITGFLAYRSLQDGTQNESGEYMNVIYAGSITPLNNINGKSFKVEYKETTASSWTTALNYTSNYSISSNIILSASIEKSYDVRFTVSDNFTYSVYTARISTSFVLIDFNKSGKAMAVGKVSEIDNTFEVGLPISSKSISADGDISATGNIVSNKVVLGNHIQTTGGYVDIWTDGEGGNINIVSPNGVAYQFDAYNDNLRIYVVDASGALHFFVFTRSGDFIANGISLTALNNNVSSKVGTMSNSTWYNVANIATFRDSNNAIITGEKGNYIFGISAWSDKRLKKNIKNSSLSALEKINKVQYREFDFIDEKFGQHQDIGYVADELKEIFPECVVSVPQDKDKCGYDSLLQVQDSEMVKYLGKAIQELHEIVKTQQKQIDELERNVDELTQKINC